MKVCSTYLKLKKCLTHLTLTKFWKLNWTCNISELLIVKEKGMTICFIMNRCLVIFLRGGKVNVVQYWWNIVAKLTSDHVIKWSGEQVITLQMAQQLKTKNFHVVPRQLFCRQCKAQFLLETDSLYWWSNKAQIVTDTDNEFTEC